MLYDICYDEHDTLFTIITDGNIDAASEDRMISDLIAHPKWTRGANIRINHARSLAGHLSNQEVINIALNGKNHFIICPPNKIAIITHDSPSIGHAILWDVIATDKTSTISRVFSSESNARQWLTI